MCYVLFIHLRNKLNIIHFATGCLFQQTVALHKSVFTLHHGPPWNSAPLHVVCAFFALRCTLLVPHQATKFLSRSFALHAMVLRQLKP